VRVSFFSRLKAIFQAKANKALDQAEDPREMLDYSFEKQTELLTQVRRGVADVATSKKRLELQAEKLQASSTKLESQAAEALRQGREDLARTALERKAGVQAQLEGIQSQKEQLQAEQDKLVAAEQKLTTKIESFRVRKETIKAQYTAAEAQTKIGEAFSGISEDMADVGMAMDRAENKVETMRARAGAIDELLESGALTDITDTRDPLDRELEQLTTTSGVDAELERMRAELGSGSGRPAGQIEDGGDQTGASS
jgi:phage shock protein A